SETAQKLEKISYILDDLRAKETDITQMMNATNGQISHLTADAIAEFYPEILDPNFNSKKKGGDDSEKPIAELLSYASSYTTEQLLARLSKAQIQNVNNEIDFFSKMLFFY
ncbi:unnamed protein product, partial [Adineta steineri]